MKPLTIRKAWALIAEAYERKLATGTPAHYQKGGDQMFSLGACGLCSCVSTLRYRELITDGQADTMRDQITAALVERDPCASFLAEYNDEGDGLRIILATLYSLGAGY